MAARKMTFTLPEMLAVSFTKRIAPRDRSRFVADALEYRLSERERRLVASCAAANASAEIAELETDFEALPDTVGETWTRA